MLGQYIYITKFWVVLPFLITYFWLEILGGVGFKSSSQAIFDIIYSSIIPVPVSRLLSCLYHQPWWGGASIKLDLAQFIPSLFFSISLFYCFTNLFFTLFVFSNKINKIYNTSSLSINKQEKKSVKTCAEHPLFLPQEQPRSLHW